jgi:hypothetical protein
MQRQQLRAHYLQLGNSIQLKASPAIFYQPAKHNEKTQALWEETKVSGRRPAYQV